MTLQEALGSAIQSEEAAAQFYSRLAANTEDERARQLLMELSGDEKGHARDLRELAQRLVDGELPGTLLTGSASLESRSDWQYAEGVSYAQVVELALEAERGVALFYSALADQTSGLVREFLEEMTRKELQHGKRLRQLHRDLVRA